MITEMNGWKIVKVLPRFDNTYVSISDKAFGSYVSVYYSKDRKTVPSVQFSKLFFFANISDATEYLEHITPFGEFKILPCIAYNCSRIKKIIRQRSMAVDFWRLRKNKKSCKDIDTREAPKGTWVADAIMIVKE
jgi:hypothetical protein